MGAAVELLRAVEQQELVLAYQPVFELATGRLRRVEALVRWSHPDHGLLLPGAFLPAAAQPGIADALNAFVVDQAIGQHRAWARAGARVPVAINVAPDSLRAGTLLAELDGALERHRVEPAMVTVEITEAATDAADPVIASCLLALSRRGVRVSLDDFGTRDASLDRLRRWHFDELKLDRLFVSNAATDAMDQTIIGFATGLAHDLGMTITAEGITGPAVLEVVRDLGVDDGQGYHLGRPVAPDAIPAYLS